MESSNRGDIEKYIDNYISDEFLAAHVKRWSQMADEGVIDSIESALIGQIYGGSLRFLSNIYAQEEEQIHGSMMRDFNNVFKSRMMGIMNKIKKLVKDPTPPQ